MRKEDLVPKYKFMDNFVNIHNRLNDQETKDLLNDMRDTILYQMEEIRKQRAEIIYIKHKYVWKQYDRNDNEYDTENRKYTNRPQRIDNQGC